MDNLIENPVYYVFSDEVQWIKSHSKINENRLYFIHGQELEDFWLMSQCKHNIIANSTYSYWAAFLNKNKEKQIIYPEKWNIDMQHPVDCLEGWKPA